MDFVSCYAKNPKPGIITLPAKQTSVESLSDPESKVTWGIMPPGSFVPFLNLTPGETIVSSTVVTGTTGQ